MYVSKASVLLWEGPAHSLTVNIQVDLWVVRREDAVGGSDDWAGGHDVCCVCSCRRLCVCRSEAVKGSATRVERSPLTDASKTTHFPRFTGDPMGV